MYAFDEEDGAGLEAEALAVVLAAAGLEVVGGELDFLSGEDVGEVGVELRQVEGVEAFVVVVAVGVARGVLAVDEVVVERYHLRFEQVGHELYGEALCGGCLAGGGWAGYEDYACSAAAVALGDVVGDVCEHLFVEGLGDVDEVGHAVVEDVGVEFADVADAYDAVEAEVVGEGAVHLFLLDGLRWPGGAGGVEGEEEEAFVVGTEVEDVDMGGGGREDAVVAVGDVAEGVVGGVDVVCGAHEECL